MLGYVALELIRSVRLQQYKEIFISSVMMLFCIGIALIFGWRLDAGRHRADTQYGEHRRPNSTRPLDSRVEGFVCSANWIC